MPDHAEIIDQIRYFHRQRCFAMEQRKRSDLALGAFIRIQLGWSKDKPEAERKKIATAAAALIKGGEGEWQHLVEASNKAKEPFEAIEARALKEMKGLAKSLPAWEQFGEQIRGFGAASLAVILAEAGDLSNYSTVAKLWKRMGLAVMSGVRQGGLSKNASAETWIAHGYNRQRRSKMWNIGDALIKGNKGAYRTIYLERKAYEVARNPEIKPIAAHRRAQRYMEKRLLRDLWIVWRRAAESAMQPTAALPSDNFSPRGERSAVTRVLPNHQLPTVLSSAQEAERPAGPSLSPDTAMPGAIINGDCAVPLAEGVK